MIAKVQDSVLLCYRTSLFVAPQDNEAVVKWGQRALVLESCDNVTTQLQYCRLAIVK